MVHESCVAGVGMILSCFTMPENSLLYFTLLSHLFYSLFSAGLIDVKFFITYTLVNKLYLQGLWNQTAQCRIHMGSPRSLSEPDRSTSSDPYFLPSPFLNHPVLSLIPSFSLPDVLCNRTDLILRKGAPFEAMTGSQPLPQTVS